MDFTNITSEQQCWLGDTNVYLPDVKTEDPFVVSTYNDWIQQLVQEYHIDGLRIDGEQHAHLCKSLQDLHRWALQRGATFFVEAIVCAKKSRTHVKTPYLQDADNQDGRHKLDRSMFSLDTWSLRELFP